MTRTWRDHAVCRTVDPELFFPVGDTAPAHRQAAEAKAVCRTCPVADACLQWALNLNIPGGIYGGLTEHERASLRRSVRRGHTPTAAIGTKAEQARQPQRERTLQTVFDDNTIRLYDGHLAWTGPNQIYLNDHRYTPRRLAFIASHGYEPTGQILSDCGRECVLPAHLADKIERAACGTSDGYLRHQRHNETACERCRHAHASSIGAAA